jgi:hypothetical protein
LLNLSGGFQRIFYNKTDPDRLRKIELYIDKALRRAEGDPDQALRNLIALSEGESALGDLIADICAVAFAKFFGLTAEHLLHTN